MTKKVITSLTISARSGKEPTDCSFLMLRRADCWEDVIHALQRDALTCVTLMIDCRKEILQFATFSVAVLQDAVCEWVARKTSINRGGDDGEGVMKAGMCGSQMVPCGKCLPVILFANRSL